MKEFAIFILVLLLIYYGGKLFFRYILPWLIMHYLEKQQDKFTNDFYGPGEEKKKEGEIKIKTKPNPKRGKRDDKTFGEYIDFEEIDDE